MSPQLVRGQIKTWIRGELLGRGSMGVVSMAPPWGHVPEQKCKIYKKLYKLYKQILQNMNNAVYIKYKKYIY